MRRLITREDVAGGLGIAATASLEPLIPQAEAMVAAYIEASSLYEREVTETIDILYDLDGDEVIALRNGPAFALSTLTVSDVAVELDSSGVSPDVVLKPWSLRYAPGFSAGDVVAAGLVIGYTPETLPFGLRQALIMTAGMVKNYPNVSVISEKIGDWAATYKTQAERDVFAGLNSRICLLLREFKKPFLG